MPRKYVLKLTDDELAALQYVVHRQGHPGWQVLRAQVLLECDRGEGRYELPPFTDRQIAEYYGVTTRTVELWRKRAVEKGPLTLLEHRYRPRVRPSVASKLDDEKLARLATLARSKPPHGHARWTVRLLTEHLVKLGVVPSISYEAVRRALKKLRQDAD